MITNTYLRRALYVGAVALCVTVAMGLLWFTMPTFTIMSPPVASSHQKSVSYASDSEDMQRVATIVPDISYCDTTNYHQQLDLYLPKTMTSDEVPLVVFVHGGGWHSGTRDDPLVNTYGANIVEHGMAFASVGYRLAPRYTYPAQDQDVSCALTYLYTNATKYHLDNSRIALFGDSAGGQLVAYAALSAADQQMPWHASLRGVVDFYGVSDLTDLPSGSHIARVAREFLGPNNQDLAAQASPVAYQPISVPPMLLFHGTDDHVVPIAQSEELADHLRNIGAAVTFVKVAGGAHGFGPGTQPTVAEIRDQVTDFFANVLDLKPRQES